MEATYDIENLHLQVRNLELYGKEFFLHKSRKLGNNIFTRTHLLFKFDIYLSV